MVAQYPWPNFESFKFLKECVSGKNINLIFLWIHVTFAEMGFHETGLSAVKAFDVVVLFHLWVMFLWPTYWFGLLPTAFRKWQFVLRAGFGTRSPKWGRRFEMPGVSDFSHMPAARTADSSWLWISHYYIISTVSLLPEFSHLLLRVIYV